MKRLTMRAGIPLLLLLLAVSSCATTPSEGQKDSLQQTEAADGPAVVTDVTATLADGVVLVTIAADAPIPYTIFKLTDPLRLVVDMSQLDLSGYQTLIPVNEGPVTALRPHYYAESADGRLTIDLSRDADYSVDDSDPARLVIALTDRATSSTRFPVAAAASTNDPNGRLMSIPDSSSRESASLEGALVVEDVSFEKVGRMDRIVISLSEPNHDSDHRLEP